MRRSGSQSCEILLEPCLDPPKLRAQGLYGLLRKPPADTGRLFDVGIDHRVEDARGRLRIGRIEAVARTPIMGFREDVSIRVRPDSEDSRVDIRSSSRYFESDLGSNAARVSKLIDDINSAAEADSLKPVKKAPAPPPKLPAKTVKK